MIISPALFYLEGADFITIGAECQFNATAEASLPSQQKMGRQQRRPEHPGESMYYCLVQLPPKFAAILMTTIRATSARAV